MQLKQSVKSLVRRVVRRPIGAGQAQPYTDLAAGDVAAVGDLSAPASPPLPPPALQPVLIPGPVGRSGTTVVMQLLGTSPQVAFERTYPFETRYLAYLFYWSRMLKWCSGPTPTWNADTMNHNPEFAGDFKAVQPFPDADCTLLRTAPDEEPLWARSFRSAWLDFSAVVADNTRRQTGSSLPVLFYAEKTGNLSAYRAARTLLGARGLHVLRDQRDIVASMIAFNRKRGYYVMGPRPDETVADYVRRRADDWRARLRQIIELTRRPQGPSDYVLRYESFVADTDAEARRLGDWLGIPLDPDAIRASGEIRKKHMTSASEDASTARWRTELDAETLRVFDERLGDELEALGYDRR